MAHQAQSTIAKINKWVNCYFIKRKILFIAKEAIRITKQPMELKKKIVNHISEKGLRIAKIDKKFIQLNGKKQKHKTI